MNPSSFATAAGSSAQSGPAAAPRAEVEHTERDAPAAAQASDAPPLALPQPQDMLIDRRGADSQDVADEAEDGDDTEDEDESVLAARIAQLDLLNAVRPLATGRVASSHGPTPPVASKKATQAARTARAGGHAAPQRGSAGGAAAATPLPEPLASVETLLARLRAGEMDADACAICCTELMAALAGTDAGGVDVARVGAACSGGALDVVLAALREHSSNAHMQGAGWRVFAALLTGSHAREVLVMHACASGIPEALACVRAHTASAAVVAAAFHALVCMVGCCSLAASAQQPVLAAMRAHPIDAFVQERGLLLLQSCPLMDVTSGDARSLDPAVLRAAVAALRGHPTHAGVQRHGCTVLRRACLGCDDDAAEQSVRVADLLRAGALEAVMSALRTHGEPIELVENAFAVLAALACSSVPHATRVIQAGALALPEPRCSTDEVRAFRRTLRECSQRAAAAADDVAAQLLAEEAAERAAREAGKGNAKSKAAKHKARGSAGGRAGAGGASGDGGANGFAESEPDAHAPALRGGEPPHAAAADPEHAAAVSEHAAGEADAAEGATLSASAERRRRRAATKAARRTGGAAAAADTHDAPEEAAAMAADAAEEANVLSAMPPAASGARDAQPAGSGTNLMEELFPWMRLDVPPQQHDAGMPVPVAPPPAPAAPATPAPLPPAAPPPTDAAFQAMKAALAKAEEEVDATKCVVCLDAQRCTALLPCKHLLLCASPACAAMLGTPPRCPLCRAVVLDSMQLFV
jgi:hypothetical protein